MWSGANNVYQFTETILNIDMQLNIDKSVLRGELQEQEPMSRHTSWKTGGNADFYYRAADIEDLSVFLSLLPVDVPVTWVGFGSNLLVRDGGIRGVVISVIGVLDQLEKQSDKAIKIGAGLSCAKVARFAARHGLAGIEFLAGIPGTIGGALAMNAGAYGGEIWSFVQQIESIHRSGKRVIRGKDEFDIAYRSVSLPSNEWFVSATLILNKSSREIVEQTIREMLAERADSQPLGQYSCGSVFKNPSDDHAARLIEDCGLKGQRVGGANVSEKHANFIINSGNASSKDIEELIKLIQETVFKKHAVELMTEVRIIGEFDHKNEVTKQ